MAADDSPAVSAGSSRPPPCPVPCLHPPPAAWMFATVTAAVTAGAALVLRTEGPRQTRSPDGREPARTRSPPPRGGGTGGSGGTFALPLAPPSRRRHRRGARSLPGRQSWGRRKARRTPRTGDNVRPRDPLPGAVRAVFPRAPGRPWLPPSLRGRGSARPRSPRGGTRRAPRAAALPLRTPPAPGGGQPAPPRHRPRAAAAANPRTGRGGPRSEGRGAAGLTHGGRVIDASGVAKFSPAGPRARRSGSRAREGAGPEPIERRRRRRAGARGYFWDTPSPAPPPVVIRPNQI